MHSTTNYKKKSILFLDTISCLRSVTTKKASIGPWTDWVHDAWTNVNGNRMRSFCMLNLFVGNTTRQYGGSPDDDTRPKLTLYASTGVGNHPYSMSSALVGADIGSDQHPSRRPRRFDVAQFNDFFTVQKFQLEILNRSEPLARLGNTDDHAYKKRRRKPRKLNWHLPRHLQRTLDRRQHVATYRLAPLSYN